MSLWDDVQAALTPLGYPVSAGRELAASGAAAPARYLVYSLITSMPDQWADDEEALRSHHIQVSFFSIDGFTDAQIAGIVAAMLAAGFTHGTDRELPYDQTAGYYHLALEFFYEEESAV